MAKIYSVGPDKAGEIVDDPRFAWIVYWYESDICDGSGDAVGLCFEDNKLYVQNLGHCSWYGPMDGESMKDGIAYGIEEFINRSRENALGEIVCREVYKKVEELLNIPEIEMH